MESSNEIKSFKTWSVQEDLQAIETSLKEWSTKIMFDKYRPIYDSLKNKVKEATRKIETMANEMKKSIAKAESLSQENYRLTQMKR